MIGDFHMYLYSLSARPGMANPVKVMDWAVRMTEKVNQIGEAPVALWTPIMSPASGTLAWTAVVPDLAMIVDAQSKLLADSGYSALVDEATELLSPTEPTIERLMQLVYGDRDAASIDAQFASTVLAKLAPGEMRSGAELGVDIAQKVKRITGRPTSFAVGVTGDYGAVMWVSLAETIQQLQAANEALNADEDFVKLLDKEAAKAYLPGAEQSITRKIA
jgi:hypothetical protein